MATPSLEDMINQIIDRSSADLEHLITERVKYVLQESAPGAEASNDEYVPAPGAAGQAPQGAATS